MLKDAKKIHCRVFGATDRGKVREKNEDSFLIRKDIGFFAVADGMGGHEGGEIASQTAMEISDENVAEIFPGPSHEDTWKDEGERFSDEEKIKELVKKANRAIFEENRPEGGERSRMGTTFVCLKMQGNKIYVANTGDSRCYLVRGGSLQQLTADHSMVEEKIQSGSSGSGDKDLKAARNYITRCLGPRPEVEVDVAASLPKIHDRYLLCSDGLTKMLSDEKICHIVSSEKEIQKACEHLIVMANEMGGRDNVTVVLIEIMGVETAAGHKKTPGKKKGEGVEETLL